MTHLKDLTTEQLHALYEKNAKLREMASEYAQEDANFLADEYLRDIPRGVDFNIGYPGDYMHVSRDYYGEFIAYLINLQHDYCLLSEKTVERVKRASVKADFYAAAYYNYIDMSAKAWGQFDAWFSDIVEDAAQELVWIISGEIDISYSDEAARECLDILVDNIGDEYETDGTYLYEVERRRYA